MECQVEPINDTNLEITWLHNGQPMMTAHRYHVTQDFGYCALDILYSLSEDSGRWTCHAKNSLGAAETNCQIQVMPRHTILTDTQHPQSLERIRALEEPKAPPGAPQEPLQQAPKFVQPLEPCARYEGQPGHFECRVTPISDPKLTIQWFKDGKPLPFANRFSQTVDFGFVSLDIAYAYPEDQGVYTCVAKNQLGQDQTAAELRVQGNVRF